MTHLADLTANDLIQWVAVAIILVIVIVTILRKTFRFRRQLKDGDVSDCGCGCDSCPSRCNLADQHKHNKEQKNR